MTETPTAFMCVTVFLMEIKSSETSHISHLEFSSLKVKHKYVITNSMYHLDLRVPGNTLNIKQYVQPYATVHRKLIIGNQYFYILVNDSSSSCIFNDSEARFIYFLYLYSCPI